MPRHLALFAALAFTTACDPMDAPQPEPEVLQLDFRRDDGECADFSTISVGVTYRKNGYPPPYPWYEGQAFSDMPDDWKAAFEQDVAERSATVLEAAYASRLSTAEHCSTVCAEMEQAWTGGACALDLVLDRSAPEPSVGGYDESIIWHTDVEATAQMACLCG